MRVYDYLEANGTVYMIMGLARGETLEARLKREGRLLPSVIGRVFARLLDGLEAVHRTGFLHRDIKPANIILDGNNNPTLIDFGASRASMVTSLRGLSSSFGVQVSTVFANWRTCVRLRTSVTGTMV